MEQNIYLQHHGIQGQKWGVRKYQNPDGTWTEAGKKRYGDHGEVSLNKRGKLVDGSGKKISKKTRSLVENRILSDKSQEEKRNALNDEYNSAKKQMKDAKRDYKRAKYKYNVRSNAFNKNGGIVVGALAIKSRIDKKAAKMSYKEAKANYKATQQKVDSYIADYMNTSMSELVKNK